MKIIVKTEDYTNHGMCYYAYDEDTYDGAPDGNNIIGWGRNELGAVEDLCEKLIDEGLYNGN